MWVVFLALVCIAQCQPELVYLLRTSDAGEGEHDVVSTPPDRGYMTKIYDVKPHWSSFPRLHPATAFDSNLNILALANIDPPTLGLLDTFSRAFKLVELPVYGSVISMTAYDGFLYVVQGLDEDVPFLGHLLSVDLTTNQVKHILKFKLPPGAEFVVGAPLVFIPQEQTWLISLGSQLYKINTQTAASTGISGNFTHIWSLLDGETKYIAYKDGKFSWLDLTGKSVKPIKHFGCNGVPSVNVKAKKIYHLQNCTELVMATVDFANTTATSVPLDPRLATSVSAQSSGLYVPFGCGTPCGTHVDCTNSSSCHTCRLGKCVSSGDCGAFCNGPDDCFAGVCHGDCEDGRCGRIGCGSECKNHDDCKSHSTSCQTCRLGKCVADGECGSYCLTSLDCYGGACVNNCVNWRCSEKTQ